MLKRRSNKLQAKRALLPGDWEAVRTKMLPADYYKPPLPKKKKKKRRMMTWTELNRRKMPNLRAREGASAKLMVMLQSWARRKYDVQNSRFTLPKQMLPATDRLLKKNVD